MNNNNDKYYLNIKFILIIFIKTIVLWIQY